MPFYGPLPDEIDWQAEIASIEVWFGRGGLAELGQAVARLGGPSPGKCKVLVVTDPGLVAAGHAGSAIDALKSAGIETQLFDGVDENPTSEQVEAGAEVAGAFEPDLLVGLGGGSAMDCAKGINFLHTNGGAMEDYLGFGKASRPMLPSIGLPTTAGTGSDAQSFCLISQAETHRKMACGDTKARFRIVILDPVLVMTAPRKVAAVAGMDAISHAVESYVCRRSNPVSRLYAARAWQLLSSSFERVLSRPADLEGEGRMLLGAHLAGASVEASMLGAAHAAANPLTARFGIVHGKAVGLMLPAVVRFNRRAVDDLYRELIDGGGEALAERLETLRRAAGLPGRLSEVGVDEEALPGLAQAAAREWTGGFNPRPLEVDDFVELYGAVL